jgi:hypothetical protein
VILHVPGSTRVLDTEEQQGQVAILYERKPLKPPFFYQQVNHEDKYSKQINQDL